MTTVQILTFQKCPHSQGLKLKLVLTKIAHKDTRTHTLATRPVIPSRLTPGGDNYCLCKQAWCTAAYIPSSPYSFIAVQKKKKHINEPHRVMFLHYGKFRHCGLFWVDPTYNALVLQTLSRAPKTHFLHLSEWHFLKTTALSCFRKWRCRVCGCWILKTHVISANQSA